MNATERLARAIVRAHDADLRADIAREEAERLNRAMVEALDDFYEETNGAAAALTAPRPAQEVNAP